MNLTYKNTSQLSLSVLSSSYRDVSPWWTSNTTSSGSVNTSPSSFSFSSSRRSNISDVACHLMVDENDTGVVLSFNIYLMAAVAFITVGLVGNALSVLVFSSREMLPFSSNIYLLTLALSDSFFLVSVLLSKVLTTLRCLHFSVGDRFDIINRSVVACKILQYLNDLFSDYSTCLILVFTVERYLAAYQPMRFKRMCTVRKARCVCAILLVLIATFIFPYHIMFMGHPGRYEVCTVLVEHEHIFTVLYITETFLFRIIPVAVIAILNVFIIVRVTRITRNRRRISKVGRMTRMTAVCGKTARCGGGSGSARGDDGLAECETGGTRASRSAVCGASIFGLGSSLNGRSEQTKTAVSPSGARVVKKEDRSVQMTLMLILVSTSYVLAYLPVLVHFIIWKLQRSQIVNVSPNAMQIAQNYTRALYIAGFSINFFLYTVSGKVFRDQLRIVVCTPSILPLTKTCTDKWRNDI